MLESINLLEVTPSKLSKARFKHYLTMLRTAEKEGRTKGRITLQSFSEKVMMLEPCYDSFKGGERIKNCWYGNGTDLRVTEIMELYYLEKITAPENLVDPAQTSII